MRIDMTHGSGGKASSLLMEEVFAKHFSNPILDKMEDAAVLEVNGKIAFSTDTFVVTPILFKGGDIGKLAVCGTVNDLLMMGAAPKYLTAGFVLEEGLDIAILSQIVVSMKEAADEAGVQIVAGDTKVIEHRGDSAPGLFINTSGIGMIREDRQVSSSNCQEGDVILLSGTLGDHHACILSDRMNIENHIESDCAPLNKLVDGLFEAKVKVHGMRDVTRGGLGTILNELADASGKHFSLEEDNIPMHNDVKGFCDILGLDPFHMGNEGKMVAVVAGEDAEKALAAFKAAAYGQDAAIIGIVTKGSGVSVSTRIGGSRVVDVLYGEGLPRIC